MAEDAFDKITWIRVSCPTPVLQSVAEIFTFEWPCFPVFMLWKGNQAKHEGKSSKT